MYVYGQSQEATRATLNILFAVRGVWRLEIETEHSYDRHDRTLRFKVV